MKYLSVLLSSKPRSTGSKQENRSSVRISIFSMRTLITSACTCTRFKWFLETKPYIEVTTSYLTATNRRRNTHELFQSILTEWSGSFLIALIAPLISFRSQKCRTTCNYIKTIFDYLPAEDLCKKILYKIGIVYTHYRKMKQLNNIKCFFFSPEAEVLKCTLNVLAENSDKVHCCNELRICAYFSICQRSVTFILGLNGFAYHRLHSCYYYFLCYPPSQVQLLLLLE